ncbi:hypothetical protein TD95_000367 [Thielaviopsis punctulata]|uniref:GPI ethanolamine phosphate transferase 2 n=1 Tax=Thielaviopsis punctulata TaxID=72032 RepID=A0A0F4Z9E6_9PEZI|nr:hypothetical protein TD95_000367 [Thielaviopsis punctulata]
MRTALMAVANILVIAALFVFGRGFFPYKPLLSGLAIHQDAGGVQPEAPFNRLVFMVIDALRSDFVYAEGSSFHFTQQLIREGAAIPFTANARSPTVTMPRLKALTTGSIPSFLDVILNIFEGDKSSALTSQDNWLLQMKAKNTGNMVMFGDDTWMKLFPDTFDRGDGTSSFYVADFTIVDNNVTRHIAGELKNDDWNTMILHYLGLDHIGHKAGPNSVNMGPKQAEMDSIVRQIYSAIETEPHLSSTLLVFCGDHGMNEAGNHGASSAGETSPALVFVSPKFKGLSEGRPSPLPTQDSFRFYDYVEQSDLVPTLAALLGFPVPKNALGATIPQFLGMWERDADKMQVLLQNAQQMLKVVTAAFGETLFVSGKGRCSTPSSDIENLACQWQNVSAKAQNFTSESSLDEDWVVETTEWLRSAQDLMSNMASNFKMDYIFIGLSVAVTAVAISVAAAAQTTSLTAMLPLYSVSLLYAIMMFGSSFVEEEHHFWYWSLSAWLLFLGRHKLSASSTTPISPIVWAMTSFSMLRLLRGWNQTGQKFAGGPDIFSAFIKPAPPILWLLIFVTMLINGCLLSFRMRGLRTPFDMASPLSSFIVLQVLFFKLTATNMDSPELAPAALVEFFKSLLDLASAAMQARMVFAVLAAMGSYLLVTHQRYAPPATLLLALHHVLVFFLIMQTRVANIPLFLIMGVLLDMLRDVSLSVSEISLVTLMLQYTSFFAFGGTNAISSIDISSGYNGVTDFNIAAVGLLTFVSNLAGPIFWASASAILLAAQQNAGHKDVFAQHVAMTTLFVAVSAAAVMAACVVMRTHLFIWTVFSPKFLYCAGWAATHVLLNVGLTGLFYSLGRR